MDSYGKVVKSVLLGGEDNEDEISDPGLRQSLTAAKPPVFGGLSEELAKNPTDDSPSPNRNVVSERYSSSRTPMAEFGEIQTDPGERSLKFEKGPEGLRLDLLINPSKQSQNLRPSPFMPKMAPYVRQLAVSPEEALLRDYLAQITNFYRCDLGAYQKLGAPEKSQIFEAQSQLLQAHGIYKRGQNVPFGEVIRALDPITTKLRQIAGFWENSQFGTSEPEDFLITGVMESNNMECDKILTMENKDFFMLMNTKCPLFEILHLVKIGNALCLCNFSMEEMFADFE